MSWGAGIEIVDPEVVRESYVARLVELRKSKGMTEPVAREQLEDNVVLGTLMLEQDEVDGLVSGAVHTTANTIRPPLQLIKTAPVAPWSLLCSLCYCRNRFTFTATAQSTQTRLQSSWQKSRFSLRIPPLPSASNRVWQCSPTPPAPLARQRRREST
ncbi:phosphate acetyltransferase [Salmonella enterica subsp. enterica]|uniref:Phosphate acetyltransferase n=1 Tax=Salmonella enterica I TaxID=59201 RepID=A0A379WQH8_SALET|nr:phosphate acetyltransferase [Salmonella enterica subsp. enterica]